MGERGKDSVILSVAEKPFPAAVFHRSFCQTAFSYNFFGFRNNNSFRAQDYQVSIQPQIWMVRSMYFSLQRVSFLLPLRVPGTGLFPVSFCGLQEYGCCIVTLLHTAWTAVFVMFAFPILLVRSQTLQWELETTNEFQI
jgi:hypothetical protein